MEDSTLQALFINVHITFLYYMLIVLCIFGNLSSLVLNIWHIKTRPSSVMSCFLYSCYWQGFKVYVVTARWPKMVDYKYMYRNNNSLWYFLLPIWYDTSYEMTKVYIYGVPVNQVPRQGIAMPVAWTLLTISA